MVAQDVVGAAAHENARLARGQLADHVALYLEKRLAAQHIARHGVVAGEGRTQVADQCGEEAARPLFVGPLEKLGTQAALLGRKVDELPVAEAHAQTPGDALADGPAAASELAADGDCESIGIHIHADSKIMRRSPRGGNA